MTQSSLRSRFANKVRRLFGVNELVHSQQLQVGLLQQIERLLSEQLAANAEQQLAEPAGDTEMASLLEMSNTVVRQLKSISEQADAMSQNLASLPAAIAQTLPVHHAAAEQAPVTPAPSLDEASYQQLEQQGLFIFGGARSGTTILTKCFNRAPEIFMLEEPNCFLHQDVQDYAAFFNTLHPAMGNCRYKGTYVSPARSPEQGSIGLFYRLSRQYRYVGEKVAIGPHEYPADWKQMYLDYHAKYFLRSKHFLTIRCPNESLWSMNKLFPWSPAPRLIDAWLQSLALAIDVYRVCPNSYLLFFNDFGPAMLDRVSELLGVKLPVPESMLGGDYVRSRLKTGELAAALAPYADICYECIDVFEELRANVSPQSFGYNGTSNEWEFFDAVQRRIQKLTEQTNAAEHPLRIAA